jgi:hypothetical protein
VAFLFFLDIVYFQYFFFFYRGVFLLIIPLCLKIWFFIFKETAYKTATQLLTERIDVEYPDSTSMKVTLKPNAPLIMIVLHPSKRTREGTRQESVHRYLQVLQLCNTMKFLYEDLEHFQKKYENWEHFFMDGFYAFGFFLYALSSYWI